ncbi:MAG: PQQ-binding-like beta-propeller repeat protein [Verrucomicrobiia bacterium]
MRWKPWSKYDEKGLARYVTPEAARWLALDVNPLDLRSRMDGRRDLVQAIYKKLASSGIKYTDEDYHPSESLQIIHTPAEILEAPRTGTCLDLAVLFCGVCLANKLLPILVVTKGHAFALVSLTYGVEDWNGYRPERELFSDRPLRDVAALVNLVDSGSHLAVECTGFAHSAELEGVANLKCPETIDRSDGVMSFERAVAAGREQLQLAEVKERPLRFAIDVAIAHILWYMEPLPIDVAGALTRDHEFEDIRLVVTLPENFSPLNKHESQWIGLGLMSTLTTNLGTLHNRFSVTRREEAVRLTGQDIKTIARDLDVDAVIAGDYQLVGESLRVNLQALDGRSGDVLARASVTDSISRFFEIQDRLVADLAGELKLRLTTGESNALARRPTESLSAFALFARGLQSFDREEFDGAASRFTEALALDPSFVAAHFYLGRTYSALEQFDEALRAFDVALGRKADIEFGRLRWAFCAPGKIYWHLPVRWRDLLLFFSDGGEDDESTVRLFAVDALTGDPRWSAVLPQTHAHYRIISRDEVIYITSGTRLVYVHDGTTGKRKQVLTLGESGAGATSETFTVHFDFSGSPPKLVSAELPAGKLVWEVELASTGLGPPVEADGSLFHATEGGDCYRIDPESGGVSWRRSIGTTLRKQLSVHGNRVHLGGADGRIRCLAAATGDPVWEYKTDGEVGCTPVVSEGVVFAASEDHRVYALDAASGGLLWSRDLGTELSSIALGEGLLFVKSCDKPTLFGAGAQTIHRIFALDKRTGDSCWLHDLEDTPYGEPLVSDGLIYIGGRSHWMSAFEVARDEAAGVRAADIWFEKGAVHEKLGDDAAAIRCWESCRRTYPAHERSLLALARAYRKGGHRVEEMTVLQDYLETPVRDREERARWELRLQDVSGFRWKQFIGRPSGFLGLFSEPSAPVVVEDRVYIGSPSGGVCAIDARNGSVLWKLPTPYGIYCTVAVCEDHLYLGTRDPNANTGRCWAICRNTGESLWELAVKSGAESQPLLSGERVVFRAGAELICCSRADGAVRWRRDMLDVNHSSHAVADGSRIYVANGVCVEAVDWDSGETRWSTVILREKGSAASLVEREGALFVLADCRPALVLTLDAATGEIRDSTALEAEEPSPRCALIVDADRYYQGFCGGTLLAVNRASRRVEWSFQMRADVSSGSLAQGLLIAGAGDILFRDPHLYALAIDDGAVRWRWRTKGDIRARPAIDGDLVYAHSADGYLYAFDLSVARGAPPLRDADYFANRGLVAARQGDHVAAVEALETHRDLVPNDWRIVRTLQESVRGDRSIRQSSRPAPRRTPHLQGQGLLPPTRCYSRRTWALPRSAEAPGNSRPVYGRAGKGRVPGRAHEPLWTRRWDYDDAVAFVGRAVVIDTGRTFDSHVLRATIHPQLARAVEARDAGGL